MYGTVFYLNVWHGILFEEPNPTGSRPRDLIGLYKQQRKPHPPNTQGRARRKHGGEQGHPEEAVLKRPRCDINGGSETEVTGTSQQQAKAERATIPPCLGSPRKGSQLPLDLHDDKMVRETDDV